jgi:hypothetical protein
MMKKLLPALVAVAMLTGLGQDARADEAEVRAAAERTKDARLKDHLMRNIDIFGQADLPAIYILMPNISAEEEIIGSIVTRDFSRDPFFMQNIDREEFELKVTLRDSDVDDDDRIKEAASR